MIHGSTLRTGPLPSVSSRWAAIAGHGGLRVAGNTVGSATAVHTSNTPTAAAPIAQQVIAHYFGVAADDEATIKQTAAAAF